MTGNADTASLVDVTNTTGSNLTFFPTFVSATTGNTEIRTDSDNFKYVPSSNTLSVSNFVCSTNFEIQGNLNITGPITFGQSQFGSIANHDTDALTEGSTNLYYTDERVDDRIDALIVAGTGLTKTYDDASNTYTLAFSFSEFDTDSVVEGSTNLFTTAARTRTHFTYGTGIELSGAGQLSVTQADINTDNVTEGSTNLFTTAARTRSHFTYGTGITHDGSGGLSVTQADINTDNITEGSTNIFYTNARFDTQLATKDTDDISEGSNQYFTTARARQSISATQNITYNSSTGVITGPSLATVAGTGAYSDLTGTPSLATVATSGAYSDLSGTPSLATVATTGAYSNLSGLPSLFSGNYNDLSNKPTLGTAAATASSDYATAAQGVKADSALQAETIDLATLKTTVANSASFAAFKIAIAAL